MAKISNATILVADDDAAVRESLADALASLGHGVVQASTVPEACELIQRECPDLALLDLRMPGPSTLEVLPEIVKIDPDLPILIITGFGSVSTAVSAMRAGACDFIEKPIRRDVLIATVERALEHRAMKREVARRRAQDASAGVDRILGSSSEIVNLRNQIRRVAASPATTTLILGESGAGKELVARAIHAESDRAGEAWVAVNCAALSPSLLEAELFGYERGAFSGADPRGREGLFEQANGGTLFLDEVGELEFSLQSKLLRILEERTVRRVGGTRDRKVDVRILAASNRQLPLEVTAGRFRADLYYRCAVITITVPPLRARRSDVELLAREFLRRFRETSPRKDLDFAPDTVSALQNYPWPGNVRELRNAVERACIITKNALIEPADLGLAPMTAASATTLRPLADMEREWIEQAIRESAGNISLAARVLGLHRSTLHRKLESLRPAGAIHSAAGAIHSAAVAIPPAAGGGSLCVEFAEATFPE